MPSNVVGSGNAVSDRFLQLASDLGRAGLNALYPSEFEVYVLALELVDSRNQTVDYFTFPVMPKSITHNYGVINNVKKTFGGITTLNTTTFVPVDIVLQGNFGRRLRFLLGDELIDAAAIAFSTVGGALSKQDLAPNAVRTRSGTFSTRIKTGYGCIKILQAILDKSSTLDQYNNPYKLYYYNPAIGESYLVTVATPFSFSQNEQMNMIWNYVLNLKAIAPLSGVSEDSSTRSSELITLRAFEKQLDQLTTSLKGALL